MIQDKFYIVLILAACILAAACLIVFLIDSQRGMKRPPLFYWIMVAAIIALIPIGFWHKLSKKSFYDECIEGVTIAESSDPEVTRSRVNKIVGCYQQAMDKAKD